MAWKHPKKVLAIASVAPENNSLCLWRVWVRLWKVGAPIPRVRTMWSMFQHTTWPCSCCLTRVRQGLAHVEALIRSMAPSFAPGMFVGGAWPI